MASVRESADRRNLPKWGKSFLTVESVQELVKKKQETVPERYIRRDEENPTPTSMYLPIIDMAKLSEGLLQREQEIKKIAQACEEWGFFQVSF